MDNTLIRTFLNVVATESFISAAERMFVTQSAVSLRIQKLEDQLGHRLFERSKSGVKLTVNGEKFEHYARSLIQLWDEAIYQTALPKGFDNSLSLACQVSLWPELSSMWLNQLSVTMKHTAFSFQVATSDNIANLLLRGRIDIGVMYNPELRQGFEVEHILDDRLVLVSAIKDHDGTLGDDYIFENWGQEFSIAHSRWYPNLLPPQIMSSVGAPIVQYLIDYKKTAYLPYRVADDFVADGRLFFVKGAPSLAFPAYAVWTNHKDKALLDAALDELRMAAKAAPWIDID